MKLWNYVNKLMWIVAPVEFKQLSQVEFLCSPKQARRSNKKALDG